MPGLTTYGASSILNHICGISAFAEPTLYLALFTTVGTDVGTGFIEVSGGSYARVKTSGGSVWTVSASGTIPTTSTSASGVSFPTSTASWGTIVGFGLYDASTSGNLIWWDYLGFSPWFPFTCTQSASGVITAPGITSGSVPYLGNTDIVEFDAEWGGTLPGGISPNTQYTVYNLTNDTFNVATTTTTVGSGMVRKINSMTVNSGYTFLINSGYLQLTLA